jgi:malate dehydrogenase (oxaloacetate-decarboxylating)
LLPPMTDLRAISAAVAIAVAAAAAKEGLARAALDDPIQQVHDAMWRPVYPGVG